MGKKVTRQWLVVQGEGREITRQWLVVQGVRTGDNYTMIGSSGGRKVTIPQIFQTMLYQII